MDTFNLPVSSREYKLMLNTDRFEDRNQGSVVWLSLVDFLIKKQGGKVIETDELEERKTSYLDTLDLALYQHRFALRLREEDNGEDGYQINLKYRDSDRYLSAAQDLYSPQADKTKFEEDISPPFVSKFSHSTSIKTNALPDLSSMKKVISLFPGLENLKIDVDTAVKTAKDFKVKEVACKLRKFQFGEDPPIKASLSFWYLTERKNNWPLVVEFSFDYDALDNGTSGDKLEMYPRQVVEGANRFFS